MSDDEEMREAPPSAPADAGGQAARRLRLPSRVAVVSVALGALVIGGAGLGLALSDAGAAAPAPAPAAAGCSSPGPRLTVQGTGQASAAPDVLTAVFGFSTTASSSTAALSQNNGEVNQALQALSANGVATSDVQTTGLSLAAQYVYPQGGVPVLTGYAVTNTVTATLRDVSTAGAAIDAVVGALGNAVQINGLTFSFANPSQVEDQARADAVHQAVAHAGAMAVAAGRRLGPVCSLTDDTQPDFVEPNSDLNYAQAGVAKGAAVPVEPGMQSETDQVTLVYALERG
jgi:uncharacterized protein YggE